MPPEPSSVPVRRTHLGQASVSRVRLALSSAQPQIISSLEEYRIAPIAKVRKGGILVSFPLNSRHMEEDSLGGVRFHEYADRIFLDSKETLALLWGSTLTPVGACVLRNAIRIA